MRYENNLSDAYNCYKRLQRDYRKTNVKYKLFRVICEEFNKRIVNKIIEDAYEFTIPYRLGTIRIRRYKPKILFNEDGSIKKNKLRIDWNETWKLRKRKTEIEDMKVIRKHFFNNPELRHKWIVYFYNEHTDSNIAEWHWFKYTADVVNQTVYQFYPTKGNRINLSKFIKEDYQRIFNYSDFIITKKYML